MELATLACMSAFAVSLLFVVPTVVTIAVACLVAGGDAK